MKLSTSGRAAWAAAATLLLSAASAPAPAAWRAEAGDACLTSSSSLLAWDVDVDDAVQAPFAARVEVTSADGSRHVVNALGEAFFVSDLGLVIAVQDPETRALPSRVVVTDLDGRELWSRDAASLASPVLSLDGRVFAYLESDCISVVNLGTFQVESHPRLLPFSVSGDGRLVGSRPDGSGAYELVLVGADGGETTCPLPRRPRCLSFDDTGGVLVLTRDSLERLGEKDGLTTLYEAEDGLELLDLVASRGSVTVGARRFDGRIETAVTLVLSNAGDVVRSVAGASRVRPAARAEEDGGRVGIPWPLAPDAQHPVGNTYGEYQAYGGAPYLHPGADVMGSAGQHVYAVAAGVVKAVLTTSGQWHWRVAIADSATSGTSTGYLYAHLDQATIVHAVGDTVMAGDYLGDLVAWPVAGFNHCHFARIEDEGLQWYGNWLATDNPHVDFDSMTESTAPIFEPARGTDLLAFCTDQTSTYLEPETLSGRVDIIAHVGDTIESAWVCSVQELRYTIYPAGSPDTPVVDDKLAVNFDMALDTYYGGPIDAFLVGLLYKQDATCRTRGDYDYREFYHILTNSNGDDIYESSDLTEAWDTTSLPDADYVVRVTAVDAAGNAASDSMTVTTANGNPSDVPDAVQTAVGLARPFPNPAAGPVSLAYYVPAPTRVEMNVYAPSGRLVRRLVAGEVSPGLHVTRWDLADGAGRQVSSGVYLLSLMTDGHSAHRTIVVDR